METIDCIKTRRSCRLFLNKEVPEEIIRKILECAITAPSSVDCQPWHFILVKDKSQKEKLAELKEDDNKKHILTAPVLIIVCVDAEKSPSRYIEDGVTAAQNILLASHDLGLGAVYVTSFKPSDIETAEKIRNILNLPRNIIPSAILPIGYRDNSENPKEKTLLNLKDIIHYDKW